MQKLLTYRFHFILWLAALLFYAYEVYTHHTSGNLDYLAELIMLLSCLSLLFEIKRLKMGLLMSFGWILFSAAVFLDLLDEYQSQHAWLTSISDFEDLLSLGIIPICISFYLAITSKRKTIQTLTSEIQYRKLLENKLQQIAYQDALTEIANRRAFFNEIKELSYLYSTPQLIFIDIDNFKQVNDKSGHNVGDELLISISQQLQQLLARQGRIYRFGGDEFVIIYDGDTPNQFISYCQEQLQDTFKKYQVDLSYGFVAIDPKQSIDNLINQVDQKMYANKRNKRISPR